MTHREDCDELAGGAFEAWGAMPFVSPAVEGLAQRLRGRGR